MAKGFYGALIGLFLAGCDNRQENLADFNSAPTITLQAQRGEEEKEYLSDSVKLSNPEFSYMPFKIRISDADGNIKRVSYHLLAGGGTIFYRGEPASGDTVRVLGNEGIYRFVPNQVGNITVRFVVTDYLSKSDSATLQLHVFSNLSPVANLYIPPQVEGAIKYAYLFDATGSYDADKSFGGVLTRYIYYVNGRKVAENTMPTLPYIFPGPGNYTIGVQVQDNDKAFSELVTMSLQVN